MKDLPRLTGNPIDPSSPWRQGQLNCPRSQADGRNWRSAPDDPSHPHGGGRFWVLCFGLGGVASSIGGCHATPLCGSYRGFSGSRGSNLLVGRWRVHAQTASSSSGLNVASSIPTVGFARRKFPRLRWETGARPKNASLPRPRGHRCSLNQTSSVFVPHHRADQT